mmetsp:Transcript_46497/g.113234  ORF Transcript_46497/g.113234 Transcript_46497/m.113234 type:complete len:241 (+) Transcript_46497:249-971(+)
MAKVTKKLCRVLSYFMTGIFAFSGLVFFLIGVSFLAVYSNTLPSLTGSADQTNIVVDGDEGGSGVPSNTPSPLVDAIGAVPTYVWFPILWGLMIMIIALFGYCGIKYYSRITLALYIILVMIVFIIQLSLALVFVTEHQEDLIGLKTDESEQLKEVMTRSADAVINTFFVVLFIEVLVMSTAACFRMQLTGEEREQSKVSKYADLEADVDAEKEKRMHNFEMQSRAAADRLKKGPAGWFK